MKYDRRETFLRMNLMTSVNIILEGLGKCFRWEFNVTTQVTPPVVGRASTIL